MVILPGFIANIAIIPFLVAALFTFISIPAVISLAKYFRLVDDPQKRFHPAHTENRIIPRAGGLAIFLGFIFASFLFIPFSKQVVGISLGALVLIVVGLIDDYRDVHPHIRLGANLVAALLAVGAGAGIPYVSNPLGGVIHLDFWRISFNFLGNHSFLPLADSAAIIWIVFLSNAVGWSGGVDGQLPGFASVAAIFLGILSLGQIGIDNFHIWTVATISFITAGAFAGFIPWNFYPQKIMPGYGGKSLAGFLLAVISVLSATKIGAAVMVLGVPLIDAVFVMAGRIMRGKSPVWGSRTHLHHRLLDLGWSKPRIALLYWGVSAILGLAALVLGSAGKFAVVSVLAAAMLVLIVWLSLYSNWQKLFGLDSGRKIF